jgi:phage baseplate assembly protein W
VDAIPHLALPLRVERGAFATVQQDTLDELVETVSCICSFPLGFRVEAPDFGIPELEHLSSPLPVDDVERQIETWEPRADVEVTERETDPADPTAARLEVAVTMPDAEEGE